MDSLQFCHCPGTQRKTGAGRQRLRHRHLQQRNHYLEVWKSLTDLEWIDLHRTQNSWYTRQRLLNFCSMLQSTYKWSYLESDPLMSFPGSLVSRSYWKSPSPPSVTIISLHMMVNSWGHWQTLVVSFVMVEVGVHFPVTNITQMEETTKSKQWLVP